MRRLLLLAPTELTVDPRARRAARAAVRNGWDVAGLCGRLADEEPLELDGVEVVRLDRGRRASRLKAVLPSGARRATLTAALRELRGLYLVLRLALQSLRYLAAGRRLGSFDVIHANDFETLPSAWLLAQRSRARLVYDAHEIYTEQDANPSRLHRWVVTRLERTLAKRASAVATVSSDIADALRLRLALDRPPLVVLNCPELREVAQPVVRRAEVPLRAIYQAGIGTGRLLDDLFRAAELVEGVEITMRVLRSDPVALNAEIERRGLHGRVLVEEPVRSDQLVEALAGYDVGLVIDRPVTLNNALGFPNKLFEYLMAGLAVVVPRLPTMGPFVEREQVGLTFEPGRPEALAAALAELERDRERLLAMRTRAREIALEQYNAETQFRSLERAWSA